MVYYDVYVPLGSVDNPCIDKQVKGAKAEQRNAEGRMKQLDQVGWDSSTDNNNFLLKKTVMHYMCRYHHHRNPPNGKFILNLMFI